ncbi:MAG: acylneuraminate cytidylyltransferase family protein [Bacteroidota bacterium]
MVLAIITARKNSKGLPGKNMMDIGGVPLIEKTFQVAAQTKQFDKIILSTDIEEAIELAQAKYPRIDVPFVRPAELSTDTATHVEVVNHILDYYSSVQQQFTHLVLLQPTSPFRTAEEMNRGVELLKNGAESVLGVCNVLHHPADYLYENKDKTLSFLLPEFKGKRRQEFPDIYFNNGAFYGCSVAFYKQHQLFFDNQSALLHMNDNTLIDIDTEFDMKLAKHLN